VFTVICWVVPQLLIEVAGAVAIGDKEKVIEDYFTLLQK
jgi:hypothetical protein